MPRTTRKGVKRDSGRTSTKRKTTDETTEPKAVRPNMSQYGVPRSKEGMLPWKWALDRLKRSHNYLIATTRADGRPHVMPIWAIWLDDALYFSTSDTSRKGQNLAQNPNCVISTESAEEAVIVEGIASRMEEQNVPPQAFTDYKEKYRWALDPKLGPVYRVQPTAVFAMAEKHFPKGVTKWIFGAAAGAPPDHET